MSLNLVYKQFLIRFQPLQSENQDFTARNGQGVHRTTPSVGVCANEGLVAGEDFVTTLTSYIPIRRMRESGQESRLLPQLERIHRQLCQF